MNNNRSDRMGNTTRLQDFLNIRYTAMIGSTTPKARVGKASSSYNIPVTR